jgi:hypothetical protein
MRMMDQRRAARPWSSTQSAETAELGEVTEERLELLEVTYSGLDQQLYRSLRDAGIAHSDVMEAHALGADLEVYCFLREEYDHNAAVVEAGATGTMQHQDAVRLGVTAEDLNDLRACYRAEVTEYWRTIALRAQTLAVRPSPPMTGEYLAARRAGLAHISSLEFARTMAEFTTGNGGVRMNPRECLGTLSVCWSQARVCRRHRSRPQQRPARGTPLGALPARQLRRIGRVRPGRTAVVGLTFAAAHR